MCILAKHYGIPFNSCKGRTSITETFFGLPKPPKYFEHIPCSTCQHWLPQASPTKSQLPHLGRAFTDIQEMKQVSRHRWMVLPHKIPTTNPGLPWSNSWLMTRLNWSWLYLWSTSSSNPQNLSTWWTDLSLPIIYWSSPFECEVSGGTDFVKKTIAAFTYPTCKHTILVDCHGYDGCPALAALEETVSLAWTFLNKCSFMQHMGWLGTNHQSMNIYHFPFPFQCVHSRNIPWYSLCVIPVQEIADGKEMRCATLSLDQSGADIQSRISNRVYEWCRTQKMKLGNFPDFGPLITSLREGANPSSTKSYRVCTQQAGRLLILESLAAKWLEHENTKDRANAEIAAHNASFNLDGEFWFSDVSRTPGECRNLLLGNIHFFNIQYETYHPSFSIQHGVVLSAVICWLRLS